MGFLQQHWIALLSLLVALIGGVPGIIAVVDHLRKRPIFRFTLVNVITGRDAAKDQTIVLLTGTATNEGNKPLTPALFELRVRSHRAWLTFDKALIPEGARFSSDTQSITVADPSKHDLQRLSASISPETPLYGHLLFVSSAVSLDALRSQESPDWRLTCVDVFDRRHEARLQLPKDDGRGLVFPKHGVTVSPKPKPGAQPGTGRAL